MGTWVSTLRQVLIPPTAVASFWEEAGLSVVLSVTLSGAPHRHGGWLEPCFLV